MSSNLDKFDHIVILMLENRSFDHMLGYLSLPEELGGKGRDDVDGLKGDEVNSLDGVDYPVFHLNFDSESENTKKARQIWMKGPSGEPWKPDPRTWINEKAFMYKEPTREHLDPDTGRKLQIIDPCHFCVCVLKQLEGGDLGYVRNFHSAYPEIYPGLVMAYYNHEELPMYDLLAEEYLVCDRWFSSVPGPTVPNRAYAMCGTSRGNTVQPVREATNHQPDAEPIFLDLRKYWEIPTIFERLEESGVEWAYYFQDVPFLALWRKYSFKSRRAIVARFKPLQYLSMSYHWLRRKWGLEVGAIAHISEFEHRLKRAKSARDFPKVSWVDPNYVAAGIEGRIENANDDHAPSDVFLGQEGIHRVFKAILESALYERILFIITYDEHGGFYDHVDPNKEVAPPDEYPEMRRYGVRVPTLIISPYVKKEGVSSEVFDHTSILKTILKKYSLAEDHKPDDWMSRRVYRAKNVADLLTEEPDQESIDAQRRRIGKKLDDLAVSFEAYRTEFEEARSRGEDTPGYLMEYEPTHLQQLLESMDEAPWDER